MIANNPCSISPEIYDFYLQSLGDKYQSAFPLSFYREQRTNSCFFSQLTNNSIISFNLDQGSLQITGIVEDPHEKRINEIFVEENVLFSCSNDSTVKLWDLNANKPIKTFKSATLLIFFAYFLVFFKRCPRNSSPLAKANIF